MVVPVPTPGPVAEPVLAGLFVLFVATQSVYFVNNLLADALIYARRPAVVDEAATPETVPTVHVLIPLYEERRAVITETLAGIDALDYPSGRLHVYLITEPDDDVVGAYVADLLANFETYEMAVERLTVDRGTVATYVDEGEWDLTGDEIPRTKATAIKYAFRTLSLPASDVVTVFDSDTLVPDDTFRVAVGGLETYDVVQAKQTVRNVSDGWLPLLEAMGMAGWCHAVYTKTTRGPYQLLGKAYFFEVADLWTLDDWRVDAITEDLTLGIDAYRAGYSLGVVDRYVQDTCPAYLSDWITQKRRWVAGPYPYLAFDDFTPAELVRFWSYAGFNQIVSVVNVVGVPVGIAYFLITVAGVGLYTSPLLIVVTTVNLVNWGYYSAKTYRATTDAVEFRTRRERWRFHMLSNPLTQLAYSMLWAVPIALAVRDYLRGRAHREFVVTPK